MEYEELFEKFLNNEEVKEEKEEEQKEESNEETQEGTNEEASEINEEIEEQKEEETVVDKIKVTIDGEEVDLDYDVAQELIRDGIELKQKFDKEIYQVLDEVNLEPDLLLALNSAINKNDVQSLKFILEKAGFNDDKIPDLLDVQPKEPQREESGISPKIKKTIQQLSAKDEAIISKLNMAVNVLDDESLALIARDDNAHLALINSVASGDFQKLLPKAKVIKATNSALNMLEALALAEKDYLSKTNKKEPKTTPDINKKTEKEPKTQSYEELFDKFLND